MSRMQRDQRKVTRLDPSDDILAGGRSYFLVAHVPPPNQHVALVESLLREALFRIVQPGGPGYQPGLLLEIAGNLIAEEIGVSLLLGWLLLVPNKNTGRFLGACASNEQRQCEQQ